MQPNENDTKKSKLMSSGKLEKASSGLIPQGGFLPLPNLLKQAEYLETNLVKNTATHLYDSMTSKEMEGLDQMDKVQATCAMAQQIRELMRLRLDAVKTIHGATK